MPFFIPIMIAATVASMIPSFLPQDEKRAREVINQDGNNYFNRQTWRTGNPAGTNRRPYSKIELDPANAKNAINWKQYLLIIGLGLGVIVAIKIVRG